MSPPDDDNASRAATQTAIIPDQNQAYASTRAPPTQYDVTASVSDVTGARCRHPPFLLAPNRKKTPPRCLGREKGGGEKANGKSMVIGRRVLRASRIPTVLTSPPGTDEQTGGGGGLFLPRRRSVSRRLYFFFFFLVVSGVSCLYRSRGFVLV